MKLRHAAVVVAMLCAAIVATAGEYRQFPGVPTDSETLEFKQKVEQIYSSGNYARAMLIYAKELAPQGDKYAQYMVGYMHLTGRGVDPDRAKAHAWYRLAAERGEPKFIDARDTLYDMLDAAEREESNALFADLWQRYGDKKLILELIQADIEILRESGSVGAADAPSGARIVSGYSDSTPGDPYIRGVRGQLEERVRYLNSMDGYENAGIAAEDSDVSVLEANVRRELENLDLP